MKKLVLLLVLSALSLSCDYMLKEREDNEVEVKTDKKVVLGTVKDEHGCVSTAGYKWSQLSKECIRPFEEGYRLNPIEKLEGDSTAKSAFVVFEEEGGNKAELFLPDTPESILLEKEKNDAPYTNGQWTLRLENGYMLKKSGQLLFAGAAVEEGQITGDDRVES